MKLIIAALLALTIPAFAGDKPADKTGEKTRPAFADVSMDDVKAAVEKKSATFVDVNGTESWTKGHIPGAIDFAAHEKDLASVLPKDKSALVIAYCGSPQCNAWKKGAEAISDLGYTNVKHFKDGIKGWNDGGGKMEPGTVKAATFTDIEFKDLQAQIAAKKVFLIDVNGSESFNSGHIPGAIDFATSSKELASLMPKDKNALIVAYCANPHCPAWREGAKAAAELGYTNVKHFKGGIAGWKEEGGVVEVPKPVEKKRGTGDSKT